MCKNCRNNCDCHKTSNLKQEVIKEIFDQIEEYIDTEIEMMKDDCTVAEIAREILLRTAEGGL